MDLLLKPLGIFWHIIEIRLGFGIGSTWIGILPFGSLTWKSPLRVGESFID